MACTCPKAEKPPFELMFRQEQRGFHLVQNGDYGRMPGAGWSFSTIQEVTDWLLQNYASPEGGQ